MVDQKFKNYLDGAKKPKKGEESNAINHELATVIIDSGTRHEFSTGAVRDLGAGKGRCDLLPARAILRLIKYVDECDIREVKYWDNPQSIKNDCILQMFNYLDGESPPQTDLLSNIARYLFRLMDLEAGKDYRDYFVSPAGLLRLSRHYELGAEKYDDRNWEKGIPISSLIDSAIRHFLKYMDYKTDEDHLVATAWNILGAMWMEEKMPELQDLPGRE